VVTGRYFLAMGVGSFFLGGEWWFFQWVANSGGISFYQRQKLSEKYFSTKRLTAM